MTVFRVWNGVGDFCREPFAVLTRHLEGVILVPAVFCEFHVLVFPLHPWRLACFEALA